MSEGNETITLHSTSLDRIESLLRDVTRNTGNPTPETIANTIASQRGQTFEHRFEPEREEGGAKVAFGLAGLPGAGKSVIAELMADVLVDEGYRSTCVSMGDAIRDHAPDKLRSDDLGAWAASIREQNAERIPLWTVDLANESPADVVVIDGVRSVTDYKVLDRNFERFALIWVHADFYTRYNRLVERGREGEDTFDEHDMLDRDLNELNNLGVAELVNHEAEWAVDYLPNVDYGYYDLGLIDWRIENIGEEHELYDVVLEIIDSEGLLDNPVDIPAWIDGGTADPILDPALWSIGAIYSLHDFDFDLDIDPDDLGL